MAGPEEKRTDPEKGQGPEEIQGNDPLPPSREDIEAIEQAAAKAEAEQASDASALEQSRREIDELYEKEQGQGEGREKVLELLRQRAGTLTLNERDQEIEEGGQVSHLLIRGPSGDMYEVHGTPFFTEKGVLVIGTDEYGLTPVKVDDVIDIE